MDKGEVPKNDAVRNPVSDGCAVCEYCSQGQTDDPD